jgi:hypothetical protein
LSKFPSHEIWATADGGWYSKLRVEIEKKAVRRMMTEGEPVEDRVLPLGDQLLEEIVTVYMKQGDMESQKRINVLIKTYQSVGRAGEVSLSTWTSTKWCTLYDNECTNWNELKTGGADPMNYSNHLSSFLLCPQYASSSGYVLIGASMASSNRAPTSGEFIFPDISRSHEDAHSYVTKYLREGLGLIVPDFPKGCIEEYAGTSPRLVIFDCIIQMNISIRLLWVAAYHAFVLITWLESENNLHFNRIFPRSSRRILHAL